MLAMVFPSAAPALSPPQAPEKVYFSNGNRIVSVNADGTGREVLSGKARAVDGFDELSGDFRPEVSPDRSRMVFLSYGKPNRFNYLNSNRIRVADADGSGAREILAGRRNLLRQEAPTWTPDGQRLVLTKEVTERRSWISSVVSVKPDGTGMKTLFTYPRTGYSFTYDERRSPTPRCLLTDANCWFSSNTPTGTPVPASR
jgi:hypothetical protein